MGAGAENPLVTEWEASEKARLESLLATQPVVVRYTGCELEVVDQCPVKGAYTWTRTTLSTDVVEIRSEDELYAKLPVGAAKLQGELSKRGALSVRTRVAGQLRLAGGLPEVPTSPACDRATHVVSGVSLGAFQLLDATRDHMSGGLGMQGTELGGSSTDSVRVLREAGESEACSRTTKESADPGCAAPLQLFLAPIERADTGRSSAGPGAVHITFPARDTGRWALYDSSHQLLCSAPCERWVPPASGYVLRDGTAQVKLPDNLAFPAGEKAVARYSPRRGSPTASKWLFWGVGAWSVFPGISLTVLGISEATADPSKCDPNMDPFCGDTGNNATFFLVGGGVFMALFAGSLYFYLHSEEASFDLESARSADLQNAVRATRHEGLRVELGPHYVRGVF